MPMVPLAGKASPNPLLLSWSPSPNMGGKNGCVAVKVFWMPMGLKSPMAPSRPPSTGSLPGIWEDCRKPLPTMGQF